MAQWGGARSAPKKEWAAGPFGMVPLRYVVTSVIAFLWLAPLLLNMFQSAGGMGPHREPAEGEVLSTRTTLLWYYEWIPSRRRHGSADPWCARSDACYVAKLRGPDGRTRKVALAEGDRDRVLPGNYVVVANGSVQVFPDKKAAGR